MMLSREIGRSNDLIAWWERNVNKEQIEEVVLDILRNRSNKGVVTMSDVSKVLRDIPLISTAEAIENHFDAYLATRASNVNESMIYWINNGGILDMAYGVHMVFTNQFFNWNGLDKNMMNLDTYYVKINKCLSINS